MSIGAPELKAISEATAMLATCDHMSEFASRVLASVKRLIPADIVAYGEVDLVRDRATTLADDRASCSAPLSDVWAELTLSEPIRSYWRYMRLGRSACFSDYVDFPQLERFEIFQRYYRPIGVRHQLVGPLSVDDSVISSVGLSRSDRDFDARERLMLEVFLNTATEIHRHLSLREHRSVMVSPRGEFIFRREFLLSPSGQLVSARPESLQRLREQCGGLETRGGRLPEPLRAWIDRCVASGRPGVQSWRVGDHRASADFHLDPAPELGGYRLLLIRREPIESGLLEILLQCSPRQAEVACLLIRRMTNEQIAARVRTDNNKPIAVKTVKKHLENLYVVLGVASTPGTGRSTRDRAIVEILARIERYAILEMIPKLEL